jgi:hypothetical protein
MAKAGQGRPCGGIISREYKKWPKGRSDEYQGGDVQKRKWPKKTQFMTGSREAEAQLVAYR